MFHQGLIGKLELLTIHRVLGGSFFKSVEQGCPVFFQEGPVWLLVLVQSDHLVLTPHVSGTGCGSTVTLTKVKHLLKMNK